MLHLLLSLLSLLFISFAFSRVFVDLICSMPSINCSLLLSVFLSTCTFGRLLSSVSVVGYGSLRCYLSSLCLLARRFMCALARFPFCVTEMPRLSHTSDPSYSLSALCLNSLYCCILCSIIHLHWAYLYLLLLYTAGAIAVHSTACPPSRYRL